MTTNGVTNEKKLFAKTKSSHYMAHITSQTLPFIILVSKFVNNMALDQLSWWKGVGGVCNIKPDIYRLLDT